MGFKSLRVAFVATLPLNSSTIVGRTIPLVRSTLKNGHEATLVTLHNPDSIPKVSSVPTIVAGPPFRISNKKPSKLELLKKYSSAKKGISRVLENLQPEIVVMVKPHPQNYSPLKNLSVPIILDSDDVESSSSRSSFLEKAILNSINKKAAHKASLITACSPFLVEHYKKIDNQKRVELVPTAIVLDHSLQGPDLRRYFDLPEESKIMLYIGSLALSSGHRIDHIFKAWETLAEKNENLHFVIAGDGIDSDSVRLNASRLKNAKRIHFFGRFDNAHSQNFAQQSDVLIDPVDNSIANLAKSSSRTLLSIKTGVPIVTARTGIRKVFLPKELKNDFFYDPEKPETIANATAFALTPSAKEEFKNKTNNAWQKWTWDAIGANFSAYIESLV